MTGTVQPRKIYAHTIFTTGEPELRYTGLAAQTPNSLPTIRPTPDRFFATYPDPDMQRLAMKILRWLTLDEEVTLAGKPEGWAAGIVYFLANDGRRPCGLPVPSNAEVEEFFGVSMGTIRKRAAQIGRAVVI